MKKKIKIEVSYIDYRTTAYTLTKEEIENGIINFEILEQENILMGEIVLIKKKKLFKRKTRKTSLNTSLLNI